jgi:hypothetical protein
MSRKKKGLIYLGIAAGCLIISFIMYSADIAGAIAAIVNLAMLIFFVVGLIYLIVGFVKKE